MKLFRLAVVAGLLSAAMSCAIAQPNYPLAITLDGSQVAPTTEQKMWGMALAAIITRGNGGSSELLGGQKRTPENSAATRQLLQQWWDIDSRGALLKQLAWLEAEGHRRAFDQIGNAVAAASPAQLAQFRQSAPDADAQTKLETVLEFRSKLGAKGIIGWDFGRYVSLCGLGYQAGYLTEPEAWQRIMPVARLMQKTFSSWQDFGSDYMIGRQFWSLDQSTGESGQNISAAYEFLLTDPKSPWIRSPWNLDLAAAAAGHSPTTH